MTKIYAETKLMKRILIVTNDSTVFLVKNRIATAFELFGGRVTEVKNLVKRLDTAVDDRGQKLCDVSFGVITTKYGFVPGNYQIMEYPNVMSNREEYLQADLDKNFVSQTSFMTRPFDKVIMCVPKDMFSMFLDADEIEHGKVIAVTSPEFREECEKRGWTFLERKGARVGDANLPDLLDRLVVCPGLHPPGADQVLRDPGMVDVHHRDRPCGPHPVVVSRVVVGRDVLQQDAAVLLVLEKGHPGYYRDPHPVLLSGVDQRREVVPDEVRLAFPELPGVAEDVARGPVVHIPEEVLREADPLLGGDRCGGDDDAPQHLLLEALGLPVQDLLPAVLHDLSGYVPYRGDADAHYALLAGGQLGAELREIRFRSVAEHAAEVDCQAFSLSNSRSLLFMLEPPA